MSGPTSGRMARVLALAAALVLAVALASGCGGADTSTAVSGEPISFRQLSRSAQASADADSLRFAISMHLTLGGTDQPFGFAGEGAFDREADRASFSVDMASFAELLGGFFRDATGPGVPDFDDPEGWKIDVVQDGDVSYVRFPAISDQLPEGKSWIRAEGPAGTSDGIDFDEFEQLATTDPRKLLDLLRMASGEIETVGTEELRGVQTTHYRALVDPARAARLAPGGKGADAQSFVDELVEEADLGKIPVDVWMDEQGLVRKVELAFTVDQAGSSDPGDVSVGFELWDYGEDVGIEPPPASQVVDASALKR